MAACQPRRETPPPALEQCHEIVTAPEIGSMKEKGHMIEPQEFEFDAAYERDVTSTAKADARRALTHLEEKTHDQ
jgi:hypothetical protein